MLRRVLLYEFEYGMRGEGSQTFMLWWNIITAINFDRADESCVSEVNDLDRWSLARIFKYDLHPESILVPVNNGSFVDSNPRSLVQYVGFNTLIQSFLSMSTSFVYSSLGRISRPFSLSSEFISGCGLRERAVSYIFRAFGLVFRLGSKFVSIRGLFCELCELLTNQPDHLVRLSAGPFHLLELASHDAKLFTFVAGIRGSRYGNDSSKTNHNLVPACGFSPRLFVSLPPAYVSAILSGIFWIRVVVFHFALDWAGSTRSAFERGMISLFTATVTSSSTVAGPSTRRPDFGSLSRWASVRLSSLGAPSDRSR